jgi:hypothetical protein
MTDTDRLAALAEVLHTEEVACAWNGEYGDAAIRTCTPSDHRGQAVAILAALPPGWCGHGQRPEDGERWYGVLMPNTEEWARLRAIEAAARDAYAAMDAACQWAATQTSGIKTLAEADAHIAGFDALLDATVALGMVLGILRAALEPKS